METQEGTSARQDPSGRTSKEQQPHLSEAVGRGGGRDGAEKQDGILGDSGGRGRRGSVGRGAWRGGGDGAAAGKGKPPGVACASVSGGSTPPVGTSSARPALAERSPLQTLPELPHTRGNPRPFARRGGRLVSEALCPGPLQAAHSGDGGGHTGRSPASRPPLSPAPHPHHTRLPKEACSSLGKYVKASWVQALRSGCCSHSRNERERRETPLALPSMSVSARSSCYSPAESPTRESTRCVSNDTSVCCSPTPRPDSSRNQAGWVSPYRRHRGLCWTEAL